jgi:hypothetical protein
VCALYAPTRALASPYEADLRTADHAAVNGVAFLLNTGFGIVRKKTAFAS